MPSVVVVPSCIMQLPLCWEVEGELQIEYTLDHNNSKRFLLYQNSNGFVVTWCTSNLRLSIVENPHTCSWHCLVPEQSVYYSTCITQSCRCTCRTTWFFLVVQLFPVLDYGFVHGYYIYALFGRYMKLREEFILLVGPTDHTCFWYTEATNLTSFEWMVKSFSILANLLHPK